MKKKFYIFLSLILILLLLVGCKKDENKQIESLEELENAPFIIGTPYLTYCQEKAPARFEKSTDFRSFSDMAAAYRALQQGKIDCLIQDETAGRVEISKDITGVKILDSLPDMTADIAVGISSKSKIATESNINGALSSLINSNVIDDMKNRWITNTNYEMPLIEEVEGDSPTLKVSTAGIVEPFSFYKDGELTGFDIELSKRLANILNAKVEFIVNSDYDALITSVQSGKTDLLISNLYITEERREEMPLSIKYLTTNACVIVKDYSNSSYVSIEELYNKKIGYDSSSTQFENVLRNNIEGAEHVLFNNTPDSVIALINNRVDAIIADLPNAKYIVSSTPSLMILPEYLDTDNYGFAFKKGSPLTQEFNEVITRFKNQNVLKDLEDKWFNNVNDLNKQVEAQDPLKEYRKTIRVQTSALLEPMSFIDQNNKISGYEADLIVKICNELNYKVEFLPTVNSVGSCLISLETEKSDVCFNCLSITEERMENYDFSNSYYEGAVVLVVRSGNVVDKPFFEDLKDSFRKTFVVEERWKMILDGLFVTLIISFFSGIFGLLLGFGLSLLRRLNNKIINAILKGVTKLIQGTPIVVLLMIMYYVIFGSIDISAIIVAIFAFGLNFGIYSQEIMTSGFETIDLGQVEAARAMGYSKVQAFFKITFPQACKKFIPVLRGEFISMVKMTSVAGYISVAELTRIGDIIRSKTMEAFFPLIVITIIYFALAELLTFSLSLLEKRLDSKNKPFKLKERSISWKKKF